MAALQRNQIPIPATLFCRNRRRTLRLIKSVYPDYFQFPLIAKATGASRGDANYLVKSLEELEELFKTNKRHFIIQEFIPNDGDYRFFVAGGVVRGAIHRRAEGSSHLNNTSQGAKATLVDTKKIDRTLLRQAAEAAYIFRRDCAGVDAILDTRNHQAYFLEVNRAPQIEGSSFEEEKAAWLLEAIEESIASHEFIPERSGRDINHIGRFEAVYIDGDNSHEKVIAKVDTGADSSSIHAEDIYLEGERLFYKIGQLNLQTDVFWRKKVKSSNGHYQERYMVNLKVRIGDQQYYVKTSLADRSQMNHDMLLGRRFLRANGFVVDVTKRYTASTKKKVKS